MAVLIAGGAAVTSLWAFGPLGPSRGPTVLVVGDSLLVGAHDAVVELGSGPVRVVDLAGIGASPCDLLPGYRQPETPDGRMLSYQASLDSERPAAVVLAFTGNPGLTRHACVTDPAGPYTLGQLLGAYRDALSTMGRAARRIGARVYLSAVPARNPSAPEGWVRSAQHGYNGDPAFNAMLAALAATEGWRYDADAALALSDANRGWSLYLPCWPAESGCRNGRIQVRGGGTDPIHCDPPGSNGPGSPSAGSLRYAWGLLYRPLRDLGAELTFGPTRADLSTFAWTLHGTSS